MFVMLLVLLLEFLGEVLVLEWVDVVVVNVLC